MSTFAIKLSIENKNLINLSEYIINYSAISGTVTISEVRKVSFKTTIRTTRSIDNILTYNDEQATSTGGITTIYLTDNVYPDTLYKIEVRAVYTDGTISQPAITTYRTEKLVFTGTYQLTFTRTIYGNIQIRWPQYLNITKYKIKRYSNYLDNQGVYFLKQEYDVTGTALDISDYYTNDYFTVTPYVETSTNKFYLQESQFFQCDVDDLSNILSVSFMYPKILKIKLTPDIVFNYAEITLNNTFTYKTYVHDYEIDIPKEINTTNIFPRIQLDIKVYNNNAIPLIIETDSELPTNIIKNLEIQANLLGILVKFDTLNLEVSKYLIESAPIYSDLFEKIYEGDSPEFLDTKTYSQGVTYRAKVQDIFGRWSDYYYENFQFKPPVPPKNLRFTIDKLTKNISLFWDYEYDSEDYIQIKKFCIVTNNGYYETVDKSFILPLTEDLSNINVYAVDVFNQSSAEVFLQLNIPEPPDVQNFRAIQIGNIISLLWELPYYEFLECFEIKINGWDFTPIYKTTTSTSISFEVTQTGLITYYIKAKSLIGSYSKNYTTTSINIVPNFYTNNIIEYSGATEGWNNSVLVNFNKNVDNKLTSVELNNGIAEVIFPTIEYNSICRSINYTSQNLKYQTYDLYTWNDFADDDQDDPYPSTITWDSFPDLAWVMQSKPASDGGFYIALSNTPNYVNASYYLLNSSLSNTTNTNQLTTSLGTAYITYLENGYTKGAYVLKNASNTVNRITIPVSYGLSFFSLVDLNIGSNLGVFINGANKVIIGVIKNIITINGTFNQYQLIDIEDGKTIVTVKLKQNNLKVIINEKEYNFILNFTPTTFIYGGF